MNKKIIVFFSVFVFIFLSLFCFKDKLFLKNSYSISEMDKVNDIEIESEIININEPGTYTLSGEKVGNVVVNATGNVKLVLDNLDMKSLDGPVILVEEASEVILYINGINNKLEDSKNYSNEDIDSLIYSNSNLVLDGTGSIEILANYKNAISSKKDIKVLNGKYNIKASNVGIKGKDLVHILNGEFYINSFGDSIKSTNDKDLEKGNIIIENGIFNIESGLDVFQSENNINIKNGEFNISSYGNIRKEEISSKGFKANNNIIIENGIFEIDTTDDAFNSDNYLEIKNGNFKILTEDDAISTDNEILIHTGEFNILRCREGIESAKITIHDGNFNIVSHDDGINAKNDNNSSILVINNGNFIIDSGDDGIDINGNGYLYNGTIIIDSYNSINTSSIDFEDEFIIYGGSIIALGSNDMMEYIESSNQYNVIIDFKKEYPKDTKILVTDNYNNEIINYKSLKEFEAITISNSKLEKGKNYKVKINDEEIYNFLIEDYTTLVGIKVRKFHKKLIINR